MVIWDYDRHKPWSLLLFDIGGAAVQELFNIHKTPKIQQQLTTKNRRATNKKIWNTRR
jgi:hypothetical protein